MKQRVFQHYFVKVFIPEGLAYAAKDVFLCGQVTYSNTCNNSDTSCKALISVWIFGAHEEPDDVSNGNFLGFLKTIDQGQGDSISNINVDYLYKCQQYKNKKNGIWLDLECNRNSELIIREFYIDSIPSKYVADIMVILFSPKELTAAEILHENHVTNKTTDVFPGSLLLRISECSTDSKQYNLLSESPKCPCSLLNWLLLLIVQPVSSMCEFASKRCPQFVHQYELVSYSSFSMQAIFRLSQIQWIARVISSGDGRLSLKAKNILFSLVLDFLFGIMLFHCMTIVTSVPCIMEQFVRTTENIVDILQSLIRWMMGNPGGLKLNAPMNNAVGGFFLYHIHLWKTYIEFLRPILRFILDMLLSFGWLGFTFQLAVITDLLSLATFHIYCFYVYAARLYNLQQTALISLWRLFQGKKWNPLRQRVDSCLYSVDQLFVGAVVFTVLFFLLPTTVVYYVVFTMLRVAILGVGKLLSYLRASSTIFPMWSLLMWFCNSPQVAGSVYIKIKPNHSALCAQVARGTIRETLSYGSEEMMSRSEDWGSFFWHLAQGQLVYPV